MCKVFKIYIFVLWIISAIDGQLLHEIEDPGTRSRLTIDCSKQVPEFEPTAIRNVTLNCYPSIIFPQFLSNLNLTSLTHLKLNISKTDAKLKLNASQFANLNVENLVIDYKFYNKTGMKGDIKFIEMNHDVLYVLESVKYLEIFGVAVVAAEQTTASDREVQNPCGNLHTLKIVTSDMRQIPPRWLKACKALKTLLISHLRQRNGTKHIRRKILGGLSSLRELEIHNCYIEELEDELADLVSLEKLDVAYNQIHYALTTTVLPALTELNLSYNHIFSSALLASGVEKQPKLRYLSIDYNSVLDICDSLGYRTTVEDETPTWHTPLQGRDMNLRTIVRLSLRGTITTDMCFGNMEMDALEYFDLSNSKIISLHFKALPKSKARRLEVNVAGCPISTIPGESFTEEHYKLLHHEELRITGLNVSLDCDCSEYLWLAKASKERRLVLNGATCSGGSDLATIPDDRLQCTKYMCGACTCRKYWQDNSTDVECSGELHAIPREPGLRRLYAAGNLVENITAADLPKSLVYLDLSKNHIARMSPETTKELFSVKSRTLKLFQNPIICDCENKHFIQALMDHYTQVQDYPLLTCIDDARFIKDVNPSELCLGSSRAFLGAILGALGAAALLVAVCVPLYCRYGNTLKVYLYSKGVCLFCIREDEIDADRPYDAFVSFSHKDELFVTNDLLPGLENEPYKYKICVHFRNWIAGELIPTQINASVEKSRRTIIVLSKNFLESVWGLLEFRTAHLSALKEGRTRLIIIIIDDILETEELDGELKSYLKNNTYVEWGDPWFWDKVRYALPHKDVVVKDTSDGDDERNTEDKNIVDADSVDTSSTQMNTASTVNLVEDSRSRQKNTTKKDSKVDVKDKDTISTDSAIEMERFSDELKVDSSN